MKRFAALALILSIGLFSFGCDNGKSKPKKTDPKKPEVTKTVEGEKAPAAKKEEPKKKEEPAKK